MIDAVMDWASDALNWILALLPNSPFADLDMSPIQNILPYINWIVPVDFVVSVLGAWIAAVAVYYIYMVILRWAKAI